ncbi:MAG: NCS2 family permease [Sphaerochaetaceae bacterium]|nr:NCS2 family permease [Sphaerochaetaceae bacterium]
MDKFFKLSERKTDVRTEVMAGITTFMTMAYILVVNPLLLSPSGMEWGKVFSATAIASAVACLVMGLLANLPFALSAGMGLNAFFTYTVVLGMGYSWQFALTAIFVEGIIFLILTLCNVREAIVNSIPVNLKKAIGAGIGLFIAYIGLKNAGIIVGDASNVSALSADWLKGDALVAIIGLLITGGLLAFKVKGAILIGIILTTIVGIPFGVTKWAGGSFLPTAPYFCEFAFGEVGSHLFDFIIVMFTFLFVDMFDTVGTLIGCAGKSGLIKKDGSIPNCKEALFADAVGTTLGAMLGTSTVTTFVESSAGVVEGGRTGLTAVTVAVLFILSLFLEPIFGSIPSAATAPALIIVGVLMITPVKEIDFEDMTEAIPAFLTIIIMVCASSISDGIMFGILSYVILKTVSGRTKEVGAATWVIFVLFVAKIVVNYIV